MLPVGCGCDRGVTTAPCEQDVVTSRGGTLGCEIVRTSTGIPVRRAVGVAGRNGDVFLHGDELLRKTGCDSIHTAGLPRGDVVREGVVIHSPVNRIIGCDSIRARTLSRDGDRMIRCDSIRLSILSRDGDRIRSRGGDVCACSGEGGVLARAGDGDSTRPQGGDCPLSCDCNGTVFRDDDLMASHAWAAVAKMVSPSATLSSKPSRFQET